MNPEEAVEADAIADIVNRLALLHGDPERFHLLKDEAARRLRRMANRLRKGSAPKSLADRRAAMAASLGPALTKRRA